MLTQLPTSPSMTRWEQAWTAGNMHDLVQSYHPEAVIFPPGKAPVQGNHLIGAFFQGGIGKVSVAFHAKSSVVKDGLAYEEGIFEDLDPVTGQAAARGQYAIVYVLSENSEWVVRFHSWTKPE